MVRHSTWSPLSDREREILLLCAEGLSDEKIAQRLNLSAKTINYHVENVKRRLDAANRVQMIAIVLRRRWID